MTGVIQYQSIALVDLNYLFKKRYHTVGNETPFAAARATMRDLEKLRAGVDHVILCRDAPPYEHRLAIFPEYKANRSAPEPEEIAQKRWMAAAIQSGGYNVGWVQGYEADDVIATLAKVYGQWCGDVRIVCPDKDASQCVRTNVIQFIPPVGEKDWEIRDRDGVIKKFGVQPELMPLFQALKGDKDDNIPGVDGIGDVRARELVTKFPSVSKLAEAMADNAKGGYVYWKNLAEQWESRFIRNLKLVTLVTNVPLDAEYLLVKRAAEPTPRAHNDMEIGVDGFIGNETPTMTPPAPEVVAPTTPESDALFQKAKQVYDAKFAANDSEPVSTTAAKDEALLEHHYEEERAGNGEADTTSNQPGDKQAEPVKPTRALATVQPAPLVHPKYGAVDSKLQPLDLQAAYVVSEWIVRSGLYKQFTTPAQVFVVMAQGKELGVGMTTALANTHMIDGKPVKHADFIRALAEKDPSFEYLYPKKLSRTECIWVGKRKGYPEPVEFPYTMEDARDAGLCRAGNYGKPGNWEKRPQDMLSKTAASKLARILWPAATMGFYCPEEFGYGQEELEMKEAA